MSTIDNDKYIDLLQKLSKYDLLLEQFQKSMTNGFYNLGRANYHNKDSLRGRYGKDYWDESYTGLHDIIIYKDGHLDITKRVLKEDNEEETKSEESDLRQRNKNSDKEKKNNERETKKSHKLTDPISMFGGSLTTPISLRECQTNFKGSLPLMIELINCKSDIDQLVRDLEK